MKKRILALASALLLTLPLFACNNDFTYNSSPTNNKESESEVETTSQFYEGHPAVLTFWSGDSGYEVDDGVSTDCSIPWICGEGAYIQFVNNEIRTIYEAELYCNGELGSFVSIDYSYIVHENVLSLIVEGNPHYSSETIYRVYNIDRRTNDAASAETIRSCFSLSAEEYTELCRKHTTAYFESRFSGIAPTEESTVADMLQNSISDENIASAIPCLDSEQRLCWLVKIYNPAGSEFHEALITSDLSLDACR